MFTEQINHDPAITFFQTGHQLPGRPSIGSWLSSGLGSENKNLPAFIVLVSKDASKDQPLYSRLWGNGFLPSEHQGVQFRSGNDPVLFLQNPEGYDGNDRREMLDHLKQIVIIINLNSEKNLDVSQINNSKISRILDKQNCRFEVVEKRKNTAVVIIPDFRLL
jgi:hypothetical protein